MRWRGGKAAAPSSCSRPGEANSYGSWFQTRCGKRKLDRMRRWDTPANRKALRCGLQLDQSIVVIWRSLRFSTHEFDMEIMNNHTFAAGVPDQTEKLRLLFDSVAGSYLRTVLLVPPVLLLSWRIWRFTILPILRPDDPKELPYWVPCKYNPACYESRSWHESSHG